MFIKTIDEGHHHKRELWLDDKTRVAHLWVIDHTMRLGHVTVRMAGIGGVYTEREHRRKGYMRHLFQDTLKYMTDKGYEVSMLFGIENFYNKFGYATALPQYRFSLKTRDAEDAVAADSDLVSHPVTAKDMVDVLALYDRCNAERTGSIVRSPDTFKAFRKGTNWDSRVESRLWRDGTGKLLAYMVWDQDPKVVRVGELHAADAAMFPTLLHSLAQQAIEKRCEDITFVMPPDHAFAEFAQRYGTRWTIVYPRYSDGMMRILNQQPLFEKLAPELSRRLEQAAAVRDWVGTLGLRTDLGTTVLAIDHGTVTVDSDSGDEDRTHDLDLSLPQWALMQLVMGYRSVRDVVDSPGVKLVGEEDELLNALFPRQAPFVWPADYF